MPSHPGDGPERSADLLPPWSRSDRRIPRRVVQPLQSFAEEEAASGVVLLVAAVAALVWANLPWGDTYEEFWSTSLTLDVGRWSLSADLRHWVNDGLMALFFLVVGVEIKRELTVGELRQPQTAAVPIVAAVGGMIVPALLFLALNLGGEGARGWGIPMATDIAFALAVLTIAARHAPSGVRPFLLTLAIVDDIGAILVIAVFYAGDVSWVPLGIAVGLCLVIVLLQRIHVRASVLYVGLGGLVWLATFRSGIHPTIAGVALGLLTPAVAFQRPGAVSEEAHRVAHLTVDEPDPPDADAGHWLELTTLAREAVSPATRVEHLLHPWTSLVIVPLFALANAGIVLSTDAIRDAATSTITLGIIFGLVVGKLAGVSLATLAAVRSGLGRLPEGMGPRHVLGVGAVAGIGFTVSILVAELAFPDPRMLDLAKVGVLAASVLAGVVGAVILRPAGRRR